MKPHGKFSDRNLRRIFDETDVATLQDKDRIVIFSDLHMGNGGRGDDFLDNASMFNRVLSGYYLTEGHSLILNGDIEELQRYRLRDILREWSSVYETFDCFRRENRLHRLVGNHDMELVNRGGHDFLVGDALRYEYNGHPIFIFHGHQTKLKFERYNRLVGFGLRYVANPLGIGNYSVEHNNAKRFLTEQRVYRFAASNRILAIMGHTHRPLFESMSKVDSLKFEIERLCRIYPESGSRARTAIEDTIRLHRQELERIRAKDDHRAQVGSLYNSHLLVPCTFNSGTVIGHRGMTCIELREGRIELVHWFDEERSRKYLEYTDLTTERLAGTPYHRVVIKSESLDYIFARIRLLADP